MAVERALTRAAAVTPSDATTFSPPAKRLYIGGAGNVAIRTFRPDGTPGDVVTLTAPPVGVVINFDVAFDRVMATNTTATLMVRFW